MPEPATELAIDASDFTSTNREYVEWNFTRDHTETQPLIRFVNNLDVDTDIDVAGTDSLDSNRNRFYQFDFYGNNHLGMSPFREFGNIANNGTAVTVTSGDVNTRILNQKWNIIRTGVTPATAPSSGKFKIVYID